MTIQRLFSIVFIICSVTFINGQASADYNGGFKIKFDSSGEKYMRIISWAQFQMNHSNDGLSNTSNTNFNLRRARVLMYAQINKDFLILTHFGLNNLNSQNMTPLGTDDPAQLFFHDVWLQYNFNANHAVGAGLHYYNGISRLNSQSTLNMLTMDNNRQSWPTSGLSDQFFRHIGVFFKGNFGKLQYRLAINDAAVNTIDNRIPTTSTGAVYSGTSLLGTQKAGKTFAGYFDYHFLDQESNYLPFKVGTYLGTKKVFNLGFGFFAHPNGTVLADANSNLSGQNVSIFAIDVFYDAPISSDGDAITAYATYQNNNYGKDYLYSVYGTGAMLFGQLGYAFANPNSKTRYQPFFSYASNSYDAVFDNRSVFKIGLNAYFSGNNSKLTFEYMNESFGAVQQKVFAIQAMVYL